MENFRKNNRLIFLFFGKKPKFFGKYAEKPLENLSVFEGRCLWNIWKYGKTRFSTICGKVVGKLLFRWKTRFYAKTDRHCKRGRSVGKYKR